jgi:hypothetical protein
MRPKRTFAQLCQNRKTHSVFASEAAAQQKIRVNTGDSRTPRNDCTILATPACAQAALA